MGRKAVEMGRYGVSEAMRNKKYQKKAFDYGMKKLFKTLLEKQQTSYQPKLDQKVLDTKLMEKIWMVLHGHQKEVVLLQ